MENQNNSETSNCGNVTPTSTKTTSMDALVARTLSMLSSKDSLDSVRTARIDMTLPLDYCQFRLLISAQAERIMCEQGKDSKFVIDMFVEEVLERLYAYSQSGIRKGIALIGRFGCGKSLIMRSYIRAHNALVNNSEGKLRRGIYTDTTATRLFNALQVQETFYKLCKLPLFIDEFGRENVTGKMYGTDTMPIVDLLFERWNYGAITHLTSNMRLDTLSDNAHYGPMVGDRLRDMFDFIEMKGESRRG